MYACMNVRNMDMKQDSNMIDNKNAYEYVCDYALKYEHGHDYDSEYGCDYDYNCA